jgi:hypothetical protein
MNHINQINKTNQMDQTELPTVAPVAWSIEVWAVDVREGEKRRPVDPGATEGEAEPYWGIGVEGREHLHDSGWLCKLALQRGACGRLTVKLIF